ncbi:DUF2865 domain-containing protein [uncultured Methylobacterium sp.]|uniref:DUF2865 domain-containing protein n=1 Tax=uncultured Methylobacterium sp. TaxID=157278 RepID=UPI0035C95372
MPSIRTRLPCRWLATLVLCLAAAGAQAQNAACQRYRAELSSLGDGASVARALQSEIGRLQAYHRALNCEGGTFLFFDTRPPQCGAVEQRIRALNATYGGAASEDGTARRRQLQTMIASTCIDHARVDVTMGEATARGGPQVICVRTCDGAFFPMRNLPDGREGADEMCQALCPGTEAAAYAMPYGDDALQHAAAIKGRRAYASLANAFKFRKAFVQNCACKPADRTWAQSLAKAESMLVRHKGDIFVTPMQAEALSRPKVRLTLVGHADKTAASLAADAAERAGLVPETREPRAGKAAGDPGAETAATGGAERGVRVITLDRPAAQPAMP